MKKKEADVATGLRIKELRASFGMNQKQFSTLINSTVSALSNWENGRNRPNDVMLHRIAKECNVSVDYLLHGPKNLNEELNILMNSAAFVTEKKELTSLLENIDFNKKDVTNLLIYLTLMETAKSNSEIEYIVKSFIEYLTYFIKSAENGSLNTKQIEELKDLFQGTYDLLIEEFEKQNSNP